MHPRVFLGKPLNFRNICLVYPPTISDIAENALYGQFIYILTRTQEDIWDDITEENDFKEIPQNAVTPFEMLLINCHSNPNIKVLVEKAITFFTKEVAEVYPEQKVIIFKESMVDMKSADDIRMITEENFFGFQNVVRDSIGESMIEEPNQNEDPRIARIKAKARKRDKIKQKISSKKGTTLVTTLTALCCMGIGLNPLNIGEISYASAGLLLRTSQFKESYGNDVMFLAGGADSKKLKPKYWIGTIEEKK